MSELSGHRPRSLPLRTTEEVVRALVAPEVTLESAWAWTSVRSTDEILGMPDGGDDVTLFLKGGFTGPDVASYTPTFTFALKPNANQPQDDVTNPGMPRIAVQTVSDCFELSPEKGERTSTMVGLGNYRWVDAELTVEAVDITLRDGTIARVGPEELTIFPPGRDEGTTLATPDTLRSKLALGAAPQFQFHESLPGPTDLVETPAAEAFTSSR